MRQSLSQQALPLVEIVDFSGYLIVSFSLAEDLSQLLSVVTENYRPIKSNINNPF